MLLNMTDNNRRLRDQVDIRCDNVNKIKDNSLTESVYSNDNSSSEKFGEKLKGSSLVLNSNLQS